MKNFKLLLATTAILSTTALIANADSAELNANQTKLDIYAQLISPVSATQINNLSFGVIQIGANSGGKKVVVGVNDALAEYTIDGEVIKTTADMLVSTPVTGITSVHSGELEFTGPFGGQQIIQGEPFFDTKASTWNGLLAFSFTDAELVPSAEGSGLTSCGTVSDFKYALTPDDTNNKLTAKVGATLTLAPDMSQIVNGTVICKGSTTVTWVMNIPNN